MRRKKGPNLVGVSTLAHYAVDPVGTIKRDGRPISWRAVRAGNRAHFKAGRRQGNWKLRLLVLLALGAAAWHFLGGGA